jgi:hypothetical protein
MSYVGHEADDDDDNINNNNSIQVYLLIVRGPITEGAQTA